MHRRRLRTAAVVASVGVVAIAGCAQAQDEPAAGDHVTVQLDFQVRGLHAMFYVADELGYFEDEGIVIDDILTGTSSGETLRLVGKGEGDIGVSDLPTLVVARSQGVPVKAIAAINQSSPLAMCSLKDTVQLDSPADLRGLSVGVQASGSTYVFYKALLAANDIPQDEMKELTVNPPYENYLLTGQVDTVPCYLDAEVSILAEHAGGEGKLSILDGADWGYQAYGTGVFASDDYLEKNPELVERFMRAYVKAFDYVLKKPEEAAKIVAGSSPELGKNEELYATQLRADVDLSFTSDVTDAGGLGAMSDEQWQSTIDLLAQQGVIEQAPGIDEVREQSFIESVHE